MDSQPEFHHLPLPTDPRRRAPSAERNAADILPILQQTLPSDGLVLEVASGTGQHALYFARAFPGLQWQPTDRSEEEIESICAWREDGPPNLLEPLYLDVQSEPWPIENADALVCINMIHISPWESTVGLMRGAGRILHPGDPLILYGAFFIRDRLTAPSNLRFDENLRAHDSSWGVRWLEEVAAAADEHGLRLERVVEMPGNNFMPIFRR